MKTPKRKPTDEAVPDAVRQPAKEDLGDLIWKYHKGERTEAFDKMLLLSLEAKKFELAVELLKLHKLDQIYGAIDQVAVKESELWSENSEKADLTVKSSLQTNSPIPDWAAAKVKFRDNPTR